MTFRSKKQSQPRLSFSSLVVLLVFVLSGCGQSSTSGDSGSNTQPQDGTTQTGNQQPSARITGTLVYTAGQTITLDGSGSFDPDGDTLSYQWTKTEGPDTALSEASTATLSFVAPAVSSTTRFTYKLTVEDGQNSASASVSIQISPATPNPASNHQPIAKITAPQSATSGETVTLDGSGSSDPDGDTITYLWTKTQGENIALTNNTGSTLSFDAPTVQQPTTFTFQLSVSDASLSDSSSVQFMVLPMEIVEDYQVPANNFAVNGDVEDNLTNWGTTAGEISLSTSVKHGGSASAYITNRTAAWHGLTFDVGRLTEGNEYEVAVWVKLPQGSPDSVIILTAKRADDGDSSTYYEYTNMETVNASADKWTLLKGFYTQTGTPFEHFIIESSDDKISFYADDFSIGGEVIQPVIDTDVDTTSKATEITVNLASLIGPATHVANGSLYGVTENLPVDVDGLIAPLKPKMFNNPAENLQQPHGDAIEVAKRVASTGATVTIRLADWFRGWPYNFSNMTDWFDKLSKSVDRKKSSGVENYYGYEIWNEPDGTWTSSMPFNDFWKQSYDKLRQLDPSAKLIGPSISWYNGGSLKDFLTFAKQNNCVPDIVSWHELSGGNVSSHFQHYRSIEKEIGIGTLPISINEYSGPELLKDEGQPGASAPLIAKFERFGVDTANISYWDVPHPGRLGTLLATDTEKNGGWWFYKWYGDMSGNMVETIPPSPDNVTTLDGFANLDEKVQSASVLVGGENNGAIRVFIKGFSSTSTFNSIVNVVVEHTPFIDRSTPVIAPDTLYVGNRLVTNGEMSVYIPNTNNYDGYRVVLTPVN